MPATTRARVAYFSMEIALDPDMPTYSGGLGILAGDTLRSAADRGLPVVGLTLVHRKGYFRQRLDSSGNQIIEPDQWNPEKTLELVEPRVTTKIEDRRVHIRAWRYSVVGQTTHDVPVYLLDTALPENSPFDQSLTDSIYLGDDRYRLCQEVVLGMGGVELLRALGHSAIENYHMNEGHSALLALAMLRDELAANDSLTTELAMQAVRRRCVFTTHTPVPAGHDQFSGDLVKRVLGEELAELLTTSGCCTDHSLNMTFLALRCSHYINGVAMHHGEVSRGMFPRHPVRAITNGVHAQTWISPPFQKLYDRHIPEWRHDNNYLRYAIGIPLEEIRQTHQDAKGSLLLEIEKATGERLNETIMTIGFARRATAYKRAELFFQSLERLRRIAREVGPFQLVMSGKAHPRDEGGLKVIQRVFEAAASLHGVVKVVYVENYDMRWGKRLVSGVDLWLNTPLRPQEASGTSGMKAALNGVPSLSILDGWWIEGHLEGVTGWSIGDDDEAIGGTVREAEQLYDKLERVILPLYYGRPDRYAKVMRSAIALNGSFFNTQRMISQYAANAYFPNQ